MIFENRQKTVFLSLFSSVLVARILLFFCVMNFIVRILWLLGGSEICFFRMHQYLIAKMEGSAAFEIKVSECQSGSKR